MLQMILSGLLAAAISPVASAKPAESAIEAAGPLGPLKGTLTAPAVGPAPVVLIIPGSGPTDRDGDSPLGIKAAPYRLLAQGLAEQGVASVRIDKRGMFASAKAVSDANAVTIADYAADVQAWVEAVRRRTGVSCVWVLGHSEGGLVALAAVQQGKDICGLVLVAAAGRPLGQIIREQLKANPANAPLLDQAFAALDSLEAGRRYDTSKMAPALLPLFAPQVQGFLISALAYDPARLIGACSKPVLILQGQKDIQVSAADARRLGDADPKARLVLLPNVNHVLKAVVSDERAANLATYADHTLPLAPGVAQTVAEFVKGAG